VPITADEGTAVAKPADPTREGYVFTGWYSAASGGILYTWPHALTASVTMHARWETAQAEPPLLSEHVPDNLSLDAALDWVSENAADGRNYIITVRNDETIGSSTLAFGQKRVGVTLSAARSARSR
jgi:uncharacterized repeat protein (TIGR02543 family)